MKPRKIPMRMCVGCREMKEKKLLIRVVRDPEGAVSRFSVHRPASSFRIVMNIYAPEAMQRITNPITDSAVAGPLR